MIKRVILVLVSTILGLLLFVAAYELVENIRYYQWKAEKYTPVWFGNVTVASPDPILMWEYKPYGRYEYIQMNRYGFRDYDYASKNKPANVYRAAFIGDSVTLGLGVKASDTFVQKFNVFTKKLDLPTTIEGMNFGMDGYNAPQIYELLVTKVIMFSPDEVVYLMCLNDFDFTDASGKKIRYFQKPKSFFLLRGEKLYRWLIGAEYHRYYYEKDRELVFDYMLRMKRFLDNKGIAFQVVLLPVFFVKEASFDNYPLTDIHTDISSYLMDNGIEVHDLLNVFRQQSEGPRYFGDDAWHPSKTGHELIAEEMARRFAERSRHAQLK
ncbi:MAG: SGNH/GDSL hydrolase family protein [Gammaproteobacteria bacterium]|nr:SGNH/GDSL hydrolase family protein [Gammaproteobacteria bacterium]